MSKAKNYYDVKQMKKDFASLKKQTQAAADKAVAKVAIGTTSEEAFTFSFDEAEAVPFGVSGIGQGTVVVAASNEDPVALNELLNALAQQSLVTLEQSVTSSLKEVLK